MYKQPDASESATKSQQLKRASKQLLWSATGVSNHELATNYPTQQLVAAKQLANEGRIVPSACSW